MLFDKQRTDDHFLRSLQPDPHLSVHNPLEEYHQAKQIRVPDQVPASAGGLNKTSEIHISVLSLLPVSFQRRSWGPELTTLLVFRLGT
jgi:hypothetical protein